MAESAGAEAPRREIDGRGKAPRAPVKMRRQASRNNVMRRPMADRLEPVTDGQAGEGVGDICSLQWPSEVFGVLCGLIGFSRALMVCDGASVAANRAVVSAQACPFWSFPVPLTCVPVHPHAPSLHPSTLRPSSPIHLSWHRDQPASCPSPPFAMIRQTSGLNACSSAARCGAAIKRPLSSRASRPCFHRCQWYFER